MKEIADVIRCTRVPKNLAGRDLVVGDLHGHRSVFERELDRIQFDASRDRVFSVGDLVDRGPESLATLALLEEPWFHAALGNHEMQLLHFLGFYDSRFHSKKSYIKGGGQWVADALKGHRKTLLRLAEKVATLPFSLHIEGEHAFNVMHADLLPLGGQQAVLWGEATLCVHEADRATASRRNISDASRHPLDVLHYAQHPVRVSMLPVGELPITYVGHSPVSSITVHRSYVYIEQGVGTRLHDRRERPPTVLEHAGFSRWLSGVVAGRGSAPAMTARTLD